MVGSRWLLASLLIATSLSGCTQLLGGDAASHVVRIVEVDLDEEAMEAMEDANGSEDVFKAISTTTFVYGHEGADVRPGDVDVSFVDEDGRDRVRALSEWTDLDPLSAGDTVRIDGAALYSPLRVQVRDGAVLAQRGGHVRDWLEVGGYPLPLAVEDGGGAAWDYSLRGAVHAGADRVRSLDRYEWQDCSTEYDPQTAQYVETCDGMEWEENESILEEMAFDAEADLDASFLLGRDGDVDWEVTWDGLLNVRAEADSTERYEHSDGTSEVEQGPLGVDVELEGEGDALLRMVLEGGLVDAIGSRFFYRVDGSMRAWDPQQPDGFDLTGDGLPDSERGPYTTEPVETDDASGEVADLLADLWGMDLLPGDRFEITSDFGDGVNWVSSKATIVVAESEPVEVDGQPVPALRIDGETRMEFESEYGDESLHLEGMQYWVSRDGYLPLRMVTTFDGGVDEDRLRDALEMAQAVADEWGMDLELPSDVTLGGSMESRLEMTRYDGGVQVAALAAVTGFGSPVGMLGYGSFLGTAQSYTYEEF